MNDIRFYGILDYLDFGGEIVGIDEELWNYYGIDFVRVIYDVDWVW